MKYPKPLLLSVVVFLIMSFSFHYAGAQPSSSASEGEFIILKPGDSSKCDKDFIVENLGDGETQFQLTLGNAPYSKGTLQANEKVGYNLNAVRALAKARGKNVAMNDIVTVFNKGEKAKLKLRCYSLKRNPLRGKDELKIFK